MALRDTGVAGEPDLPPGAAMDLPGRGTTFVRTIDGPPGAETLVLLHGWTASADLNWFTCYRALGERYRVIALDHRGHGRGIRSKKPFRLEDCADDAAAVCDVLGVERFIPVGYSMGGTIAQLMWHRHRERVNGVVLCATAAYFATSREERFGFRSLSGLAALARLTPVQLHQWATHQFFLQRRSEGWSSWATKEVARHDWRAVLEAGKAIGGFSSMSWVGEIDVPVGVLVTTRDNVVPTRRQLRLLSLIPSAEAFRVEGEHDVVVMNPAWFVPSLLRTIQSVTDRLPSPFTPV
jgi:3-oxoadipate enol-lactonase